MRRKSRLVRHEPGRTDRTGPSADSVVYLSSDRRGPRRVHAQEGEMALLPSMRRWWAVGGFGIIAVGAGVSCTACNSPTQPRDRVVVTLVAMPTAGLPGDTVHLVGIAFNPTTDTISASFGCSPGIGFYVTAPDGLSHSMYEGLYFTCQLKDSNLLEPGETDSVAWSWQLPTVVGTYDVRAALENEDGPPTLSPGISVVVE